MWWLHHEPLNEMMAGIFFFSFFPFLLSHIFHCIFHLAFKESNTVVKFICCMRLMLTERICYERSMEFTLVRMFYSYFFHCQYCYYCCCCRRCCHRHVHTTFTCWFNAIYYKYVEIFHRLRFLMQSKCISQLGNNKKIETKRKSILILSILSWKIQNGIFLLRLTNSLMH